jgi:hypothetical protein
MLRATNAASARAYLPFLGLALILLPALAFPAGAQQKCSDTNIVAEATAIDRNEAIKNADLNWGKEASVRMGTKTVYHGKARVQCKSAKGGAGYTCTVSAKACTAPVADKSRRGSCWPHGDCEVCCGDYPNLTCWPQCK